MYHASETLNEDWALASAWPGTSETSGTAGRFRCPSEGSARYDRHTSRTRAD